MDKATVLGNLTRIRQAFIADRTQRKQEKKYVVESRRPFRSFKKRGSAVVVSGNIESMCRIKEAGPVLEFLEEIMLGNDDHLDQPEYATNESEDPASFIPKVWCQIGDISLVLGLNSAQLSADMEFVQKFTPLDFQVKNSTLSILPNFNSFSKKKAQKMSENGEIYTAGKNFTLPPAVTA